MSGDSDRCAPVTAPDPAPRKSVIAFEPNELAFPSSNYAYVAAGLTKREWFAGLAMQGILASWPSNARMQTENTGGLAVEFADALIAALNAEPQS